jgi:hypothetical protein
MEDVPTQILTLAAEARQLTDVLKGQVATLQADQMTNTDKLGVESVSALIGAYERQLQHTGQLLIAIAKLGLEDRRTRVAEGDHRKLWQAVVAGVNQCEPALSHDQQNETLRSIGRCLEKAYGG